MLKETKRLLQSALAGADQAISDVETEVCVLLRRKTVSRLALYSSHTTSNAALLPHLSAQLKPGQAALLKTITSRRTFSARMQPRLVHPV